MSSPRQAWTGPLWWVAPRRLLGQPGWLLVLALATALGVAAFAMPVWYVAGAEQAGLDRARTSAAADPSLEPGLIASWRSFLPPPREQVLLDSLAEPSAFGTARLTGSLGAGLVRAERLDLALPDGRTRQAVLLVDVDGVLGVEDRAVHPIAGTPLPLADGARTSLLSGLDSAGPDRRLPVSVGRTVDLDPPEGAPRGATVLVASRATFAVAARRLVLPPLFVVDRPLRDGPLDLAAARRASDQVVALSVSADVAGTPLRDAMAAGRPRGAPLRITTDLGRLVAQAEATAGAVRASVRPFVLAGQVLAGGVVVVALLFLARTRRHEGELLARAGVPPPLAGLLTVLELLPALVVAVPLGLALALVAGRTLGPPTRTPADVATGEVLATVGTSLGVLVALTWATAVVTAVRAGRSVRTRSGRTPAVRWQVLVVSAGIVVVGTVLATEPGDRSTSVLAGLFPLAVTAVLTVVVLAAAARLRAPLGARPGSARWLAARRSAATARDSAALLAVLGIGVASVGYLVAVHRGVGEGVADKAAALAGAPTVVSVAEASTGPMADAPVGAGSALVYRQQVSLPPAFGQQPLLALDPDTFGRVAAFGRGELRETRDLLDRLDPGAGADRSAPVPVVLAGATDLDVGTEGTMSFYDAFTVPFRVVAVVEAFPGAASDLAELTVVVDADALLARTPTGDPLAPTESPGIGVFERQVWSRASPGVVTTALAERDLVASGSTTLSQVRAQPRLLAAQWGRGYLLGLGAVSAALALLSLLVLTQRLVDRDAGVRLLLRRMGYAPAELRRVAGWETARCLVVAAACLAVTVGALVLVLPPTVDQVLDVEPVSRPALGGLDVALLALGLLAAWLAAYAWAATRIRRDASGVPVDAE